MKFIYILPVLFALVLSGRLRAQISEASEPYSIKYNLDPVTKFESMPYFSKSALIEEDRTKIKNGLKSLRFAKMLQVAYHPYNSGTWDETPSGRVWRLGIHSGGAYSLYLVFSQFHLKPGVKIFVYNLGKTSIAGAFTDRNNNRFNKLAIAPIDGDAIIIELDIPSEIEDFGDLVLSEVGHDYTNKFGSSKLKSQSQAQSDSCEVDINCPAGALWQTEKRAVCRLIVGGYYCTGTLINNALHLKIPYLLTAYHCVQTQDIASGGVFFFNYEKTGCNQGTDSISQSLSGAELVATTNNQLDFSLLKLNQFPPANYKPYFAGWDVSTGNPVSGVVIHHPGGDVKKISISNHELFTSTFGDNFDTLSNWMVTQYDLGATEGGSSGAPIFNSQHRLYGTLTGGQAYCGSPYYDFYTKFCLDWDKYSDSAKQVKCWLNPKNKNILYLNGIDPYDHVAGMCDTFWNISKHEPIQLYKEGLKWGYYSGQNASGYTQFAEKIVNQTLIDISEIYVHAAKVYSASPYSTITFKIWEGNQYPISEIYQKSVYTSQLRPNSINTITLDSAITVGGNFFIGYEVNYSSPQDTFTVYQSTDRGLPGPSTMYVSDGVNWKSIDNAYAKVIYSSLKIGLLECTNSLKSISEAGLKVMPTAFTDYATIELPEGVTIKDIITYDCIGRRVFLNYTLDSPNLTIYSGNLAAGIYTLVVKTSSRPMYARFIIIRK